MTDNATEFRESFINLIENESVLDGRFVHVRRIDPKAGDGYFSLVFIAYDNITKQEVILKFYDPLQIYDLDRVQRFNRESEMLVLLKEEPYVINCIDGGIRTINKIMVDPSSKTKIPIPIHMQYIAMEKADKSAEHFIIHESPETLQLLKTFRGMYKAVNRIHKRRICHRDLKPNNFLIRNDQVCLGDFGTAKCMDGSMPDIRNSYANPVGHLGYCAPELFFSIGIADEFVYNADIFSLGSILFEFFTERTLTQEIYDEAFLKNIYMIKQVIDGLPKEKARKVCLDMVSDFAKTIILPDIFSFNTKVPNSIKLWLNELYKSMVNINFIERLNDPSTIFRRIDICIKILTNQNVYDAWLMKKKLRNASLAK